MRCSPPHLRRSRRLGVGVMAPVVSLKSSNYSYWSIPTIANSNFSRCQWWRQLGYTRRCREQKWLALCLCCSVWSPKFVKPIVLSRTSTMASIEGQTRQQHSSMTQSDGVVEILKLSGLMNTKMLIDHKLSWVCTFKGGCKNGNKTNYTKKPQNNGKVLLMRVWTFRVNEKASQWNLIDFLISITILRTNNSMTTKGTL